MARRHDIDRIREERRGEILGAACRLFATRGYSATGVQEIAAEVGVTHGTLYLYFKSKDELLRAVVAEGYDRLETLIRVAVSVDAATAGEKVRRLFDALTHLSRHDLYFVGILTRVYGQVQSDHPELTALSRGFHERLRTVLRPVVEEGRRDGSIAAVDSQALIDLVYVYTTGLVATWGLEQGRSSRKEALLKLVVSQLGCR
jgi:AcrR family transcriptional regulator